MPRRRLPAERRVAGPVAHEGGECTGALDGEVAVDLATWTSAQRGPLGTDPLDGFVLASITRIELAQATVPEPSTAAPLAGGVLALGATASARRMRQR